MYRLSHMGSALLQKRDTDGLRPTAHSLRLTAYGFPYMGSVIWAQHYSGNGTQTAYGLRLTAYGLRLTGYRRLRLFSVDCGIDAQ